MSDGTRPVGIVMDPTQADEAEGVTIRRTVGSERLIYLDPFLLLDHLHVAPADETRSVGFPRHPHRGIETLTVVYAGRVHHRDSLGNDDGIGAGGSQWMTAGGGIFHAEMLEVGPEGNEALQLWFNLPAAEKRKPAAYRAAVAEGVPAVDLPGGGSARVIAGSFEGTAGAFDGIAVRPTVLDVALPAGATVELPAPEGESTVAYLLRGRATFGEGGGAKEAKAPQLVIFDEQGGSGVRATTAEDSHLLFVSARPLREPVLQYRSLVMNTVGEIRQALADIEAGTFAPGGKEF